MKYIFECMYKWIEIVVGVQLEMISWNRLMNVYVYMKGLDYKLCGMERSEEQKLEVDRPNFNDLENKKIKNE